MSVRMVSMAQTTTLRFQSTWPAKDIFHEYAQDYAKKVNDMAGSRLKIEVLPAGSVVPAFQLLDAVAKGTLDGATAWSRTGTARIGARAVGLRPGYAWTPTMVLAWHTYGGGKALMEEIYKGLNLDVVSYLYGPCPRSRWAGSRSGGQGRGHEGPEVPHRGPGGGRVHRHGRGREPAARRRDRARAGPRPDRRGRVQQCVERPRAGLSRRRQELHAAELPPERRAVRGAVQRRQAQGAADRAQVDHRVRHAGRERRDELEGHRPQLEDYEELKKAGIKFYKTPDTGARAARIVGQDHREKSAENPMFQEGARLAARLRGTRGPVAERLRGRFQDGLQPLLRTAGEEDLSQGIDATRGHPCGALFMPAPKLPRKTRMTRARSSFRCNLSCWRSTGFHMDRQDLRLVRPAAHAADQLGGVLALCPQQAPAWVLDAQIMLYGTMFMTAGAYTLSKNGHVRGDVLYGFFRPRTQALGPGALTSSSSCPASWR
ncbi:monocarboxylate 2-oxoacid-binding periplasmic protein [Ditylenchus destructor]|uniref:Monocarboxylate 2-oxoacid-binding periplasmic protein n=1 Tax=Ditylenchus destructor TaxID=166010 RepID=A0AAD4MJH3_9BILA|nr:monocarboxylate 2-oxoacid-binding periplasmic protein [Ditylenchus destructor]